MLKEQVSYVNAAIVRPTKHYNSKRRLIDDALIRTFIKAKKENL